MKDKVKMYFDEGIREKLRKNLPLLLWLVTPGLSWALFEFIIGDISQIGNIYIGLNLVFFYVIYMTAFFVTNRMKLVFPILNGLFAVVALAEYFVVSFRARPILIWDVLAFRTAMTVSGNYSYDITPHLVVGVGIYILLSVGAVCAPMRLERKKTHLYGAGAAVVACTAWFAVFYIALIPGMNIEINMWDPYASYCEKGYLLSTMVSFTYLKVEAPAGYSAAAVKDIGQEILTYREETLNFNSDTDVIPENIICIMNESFADHRVIGDFSTDEPFLSFYDSLEDNCVKGNLYMPVFGSMTCNSEYEFLTGNSMAFAPEGSVPYQTYMYAPVYGMASNLKAQGYKTVAMHPNEAGNWNRDEAMAAMGFDEFLAGSYFEDSPLIRNYVSDMGNYEKIIELTQNKEQGQPLFVFDVTMQNHGGYDQDYEENIHLTEYEDFPLTEQYLSLIQQSDEALSYLLNYYSGIDTPTMVVMFGDHQPSVEEEFYDAIYGSKLKMQDSDMEDYSRRYMTPFFIWTNYDMPSQTIDKISALYLSTAVMSMANLELTDYQYFLNHMYRAVPVIHIYGYYNSEGLWESWNGWREKKEYPLFHQYELLLHNNMFGKRKRLNSLFSLSDESVPEK